MKSINIEQPHGYLKDSDGRIVLRFGNWDVNRDHYVPDVVDQIDYVGQPDGHDEAVAPAYQD